MNQNFQWPQLLMLVLFMGMAAASWIFGEMRQQAARKRARAEARRRYEEQLRTGRASETEGQQAIARPASGQSEAQRLAARRQAQLQHLRARQAGGQQRAQKTGAPTSASPTPLIRSPQTPMARPLGRPPSGVLIQRVPAATTPSIPRPRTVPGPGQRSAPPLVRGPAPRPRSPGRAPARRPGVAPGPAQIGAKREGGLVGERSRAPISPASAQTHSSAGDGGPSGTIRGLLFDDAGAPRSPAELRSLIAVSEILSSPMSMRDQSEMPWSRA